MPARASRIELQMAVIGRENEIRVITAALDAVRAGHGTTLLITGEAGIGKTRLAAELAAMAADQAMVVLTGRASPSESAPPLWPWWQALSRRSERDLLPSSPAAGPVGDEMRVRWEAFHRVGAALTAASATNPTVIVLDDMHWADQSSLQLAAVCAGSAGVVLAVTFRYRESNDELGTTVSAMQTRPGTIRLMLHPWSLAEVAAAAPDLDPTWWPLIHDGSAGNPLIVAEMVSSLADADLTSATAPATWPLGVPARLADITAHRIAGLPDTARAAVLAVYLLGDAASAVQIAELAELDPAEVHDAITAGVAARLLLPTAEDPVRVTASHELLREAGYQQIDARTRLHWHRRAADLIESGRLSGDLVGHRLRCLVDDADRDRALHACRVAAAEATARLGYDRAVAVLDQALALPGLPPAVRADLLLEAATAELRAGAVDEAARRCQQAATRPTIPPCSRGPPWSSKESRARLTAASSPFATGRSTRPAKQRSARSFLRRRPWPPAKCTGRPPPTR